MLLRRWLKEEMWARGLTTASLSAHFTVVVEKIDKILLANAQSAAKQAEAIEKELRL